MASYASKVMRMAAIAAATALALSACNKGSDATQGAKDGKGQQAAAQKKLRPLWSVSLPSILKPSR